MAIQLNKDAFVSGWIYCYKTLYVSVGITLVARETGGQLTGVKAEIGITSSDETWDCLKSGLTEAALSWVEKLWDKKKIQKLGPRERVTGCNIRIAIKYQKAATISSDRISLWLIMPPPLPVSQEGISQLHDQLIIMGSLLFSSTSHLVSVESCLRFFTGILALGRLFIRNHYGAVFLGRRSEGTNPLKTFLVSL